MCVVVVFVVLDYVGWAQGVLIQERKNGATNAADLILHRESLVNFNSDVFNRRFEGDIVTPDVCRATVYQPKTRYKAPTGISSGLSVFNVSSSVFIHDKTSSMHV